MNFEEYMKLAGALLASLGGGGVVVVALSSWLGKYWAQKILATETHKLQLLRDQFQIQYASLHKEQKEIIQLLHENLCDLREGAGSFSFSIKMILSVDAPEADFIQKVIQAALDNYSKRIVGLLTAYKANTLYLDEELCAKIQHLLDTCNGATFIYYRGPEKPWLIDKQFIEDQWGDLEARREDIESQIEEIRADFKKLLGVHVD